MGYQERHQRKRERFLELKPITAPVNRLDRLLTLREVAAVTRCNLWTVRDRARLNLHITRSGKKNYLWLSQVLSIEWPKSLTDREAAKLISRPPYHYNGMDIDGKTGIKLPRSIRARENLRVRKRIRKLRTVTGEMPPLFDDYEYRSLMELDKQMAELSATLEGLPA